MGQSCNQKQTMISNQMYRDEGHHDALFGMIEMLQAPPEQVPQPCGRP